MKEIYLIRHGQTDFNKNRIIQGSGVDSNINQLGKVQGQQFYDHYHHRTNFDAIIHSALKRTRQTIQPWIDRPSKENIPVIADDRLNEISWGDHEGKQGTQDDAQLYMTLMQEWASGNYDIGIANGETIAQLHSRLSAFRLELLKSSYTNILICSHGRAIRCLMCVLTGVPPSQMQKFEISNVGLYILRQNGDLFNVIQSNDTSHRTALT